MEQEERIKILEMLRSKNLDIVSCGLSLWEGFVQAEERERFREDLEALFQSQVTWDLASEQNEILNINELIQATQGYFIHRIQIVGWVLEKLQNIFRSGLCHVTAVSFAGETISEIPKIFWTLRYIEDLSLEGCGLEEMPKEICSLENLKSLDLSWNKLLSLPSEIASLQKLQRLCLHHNHLRSIPDEVGHLLQLRELILDNNALTYLPDEIEELFKLEHLTLFQNSNLGESLPECIYGLKNLKYLEINPDTRFNPFIISDGVEVHLYSVAEDYWVDIEEYKLRFWEDPDALEELDDLDDINVVLEEEESEESIFD